MESSFTQNLRFVVNLKPIQGHAGNYCNIAPPTHALRPGGFAGDLQSQRIETKPIGARRLQ